MQSRDFVYWLQGYFEISNNNVLLEDQVKVIKNHLAMVFKHEIDPSFGGPEVQKELNKIHEGNQEQSVSSKNILEHLSVAHNYMDLKLNC